MTALRPSNLRALRLDWVESTVGSPLYGGPFNCRFWPFSEVRERPLL